MFHIALLEPEIPGNTGNIGRTCVATGSSLHLIDPLGFILNDKTIARAGMDYWPQLDFHQYLDYGDFMAKNPGMRIFYATTKARRSYDEVSFQDGDCILFGKESAGIPEDILVENEPRCIRIPMRAEIRSLNLANSVAIVLYEALRQTGFAGLSSQGELHHGTWAKAERKVGVR